MRPLALLSSAVRHAFAMGTSVGLHVMVVGAFLVLALLDPDLDEPPGEAVAEGPIGNDGGEVPLGADLPVDVSLYTEAAPPAAPADLVPNPTAAPKSAPASAGAPTGDKAVKRPTAESLGSRGSEPRGKKAPCDPIEEIIQLSPTSWEVERGVIDWYATRPSELGKQLGATQHKDDRGKPDGARIYLPRCSVLRQAGIRNGDIVHTIDERRVSSVPEALAAWLALRGAREVRVELTRKNGERLVHRYAIRR